MMKDRPAIWPRRLLCLTLISVFVFFSARVYYRLTDDFRLRHIVHELPHNPDWEIPITSEDRQLLEQITEQPFTYLGKGAQSYAFVSQDGQYVLKFFKFKHLKPSWIVNHFPDIGPFQRYKEKSVARKKRQIQSVFTGYKLAYDVHREESGLLFIHLNPTNGLNMNAVVFDKIGRRFEIPMDPYIFIVQRRADINRDVMDRLLKNGELELAKQRVRQVIELYLSEYAKGIYDRDHGVLHNIGFIGEKPIHLDIGKLTDAPHMKNPENWESDLEVVVMKYHRWMREKHPEYYEEVMSTLEEELSKAFGKPYKISG